MNFASFSLWSCLEVVPELTREWNPDIAPKTSYLEDWSAVPEQEEYDNAFKAEWTLFLRHVVRDEPFRWNLFLQVAGGT